MAISDLIKGLTGAVVNTIEGERKKKTEDQDSQLSMLSHAVDTHPDPSVRASAIQEIFKHGKVKPEMQGMLLKIASTLAGHEGKPQGGDSGQQSSDQSQSVSSIVGDQPKPQLPQTSFAAIEKPPLITGQPKPQSRTRKVLGKVGDVALGALEGAATFGASADETFKKRAEERQLQQRTQLNQQESQLRTQEEAAREKRQQAYAVSPEAIQAIRAKIQAEAEAKGEVEQHQIDIATGKRATAVEKLKKQYLDAHPNASGEEAEEYAMRQEEFLETGKVAPASIKPFGSQKVKPDPSSSTGYRYYQEFSDGSTKDMEEAPSPGKAKPDYPSGEIGERERAQDILTNPKATPAQKKAAQGYLRKIDKSVNEEAQSNEAPIVAERPTGKDFNNPVPGTGMTKGAVWQTSGRFALTGVMPSLGLGSSGSTKNARTAIIDTASWRAEQAGTDLATLQADYRANASTLTRLTGLYGQTEVNEQSALKYFDLLKQTGQRMDAQSWQVAIPAINQYIRTGQVALTGNTSVNNYLSLLTTSLTEYAKVVSGQTTGAAVSDKATEAAQNLVHRGLSTSGVNDWIDNVATGEMHARSDSYIQQINRTSNSIASFLAGQPVSPAPAQGTTAPTPPPGQAAATAPAAQQRLTATNPTTGEKIESTDGGKSWHKAP